MSSSVAVLSCVCHVCVESACVTCHVSCVMCHCVCGIALNFVAFFTQSPSEK